MKNLKDISDNSLSELRDLMGYMFKNLETFSHVEEFVPKSLIKEMNKFSDKLEKEFAKREDKF